MSRFLRLCFGAMVRLFRSRKVLLVENLALRQQLSVFKRPNRRPKLGALDRLIPDRSLPDKAIDLIDEAGARVKLRQTSLLRRAAKSVIEKFREKYGAKDVKKYYSHLDVAVVVERCNQRFLELNLVLAS